MIDKFSDDNLNYKYESGLVKRIKKKLKNKNNNLTLKKQKTSKDYRKTFKK